MSAEDRYIARRFALKVGILALCALAQWKNGYALTLAILFGIASVIDMALAFYQGVTLRWSRLSYWDETIAFALMSGIATIIAKG